ncbi:hypothetical protein GCM10010435_24210 [Winogradskya consettensis]|uniref:DUF4132 domain-containing protein n=1 Tax=Winogradskya consettensis TaxID=113560 RepID=A0A919VZR2_9ACTN|nr:DUF4132 domain-containing protein [Actinoplanes consettensis]GIM82448.1 hypothetical protein Aco04nite_81530 [Actinoplanes consettensis]
MLLPEALEFPAATKVLPGWVALPALPPIVLRDGDGDGDGDGRGLPEIAVRRLLGLLTLSTFVDQHPALAPARAACDPASLAAFSWALYEQWRVAGSPPDDKHAMLALTLLGDESAVPAVAALFPEWSYGTAARVSTEVEMLGAIGTDVALSRLQHFARTAGHRGLRRQAREKLHEIARRRELSDAELADRLVPDLGLDARGRRIFDYGPRQFVVTLDQFLRPVVSDTIGRRLPGLPRPRVAEAAGAAAAREEFAAFKKEARVFADERLRALEDAMLGGRIWTLTDLRALVLDHPVVRGAGRALVWQVMGGPSFRVAEDDSYADIRDETVTLAADARVRLFHQAFAEKKSAIWAGIFTDYEIIQPFPQLSREFDCLDLASAPGCLDAGY